MMCPSHRVTHDEEHSTRGRAHLLWELMSGDVLKDDALKNTPQLARGIRQAFARSLPLL